MTWLSASYTLIHCSSCLGGGGQWTEAASRRFCSDTEGLPTLYQFHLWSICGGRGICLYVREYPLPSGLLLGSFIDQSVSLDLNSAGVTLEPGGTYYYSVSATSTAGTTESSVQTLTTPEDGVQPLSTTTSPLSGAGQSAGSDASSSGQPAASAGSSSSPTPGVGVLGTQAGKTIKLKALTNEQKLAKALKVCEKKPKSKRTACEKQARKKYSTSGTGGGGRAREQRAAVAIGQ